MRELDTIVKDCTIEEIVDDAIKEFETDEELREQHQRLIKAKAKANQYKKGGFSSMKEYLALQSEMVKIQKEIIENRNASNYSEAKILKVAEKNNEGINTLNVKFNKIIYALFVVFFLLGVFTGIMDEVWKPYITDILNFTRASSNIMKG